METRKVQLSGGTTYTISLPKKWAQEHGIDAGSVLALHPNGDSSLLIEAATERSTDDRTVTVDVSTTNDKALRQRILALHAVGFDEVTLTDSTGHSPQRQRVIEETIAELSGFEVLETTDRRIKLTNLISAKNVDIRKSVLRLRLVMLSMHSDGLDAVITGDAELAKRVISRDSEADKIFAMITRHFRRSLTNLYEVEKLDHSRNELFEYYYIARQFERIADHAEKMANFALDPDVSMPDQYAEEFASLGSTTRRLINDAADAILTGGGIETANGALAKYDTVTDQFDNVDRELYDHDVPNEAYVLGLVLDSLRRTADYGVNIATVAIEKSTRQNASS